MPRMTTTVLCGLATLALLSPRPSPAADNPKRSTSPIGPLSPREALKTFTLPHGLKIEIVAAEPDVLDPVAVTFDARGRMFALEMGDYPLGPGKGKPPLGRVKLLEDSDGDGRVDKSTVFADRLLFALGIAPWKNGLIVAAPPEFIYFEDTDGDGRADKRQVLFDGFAVGNPQHRTNFLIWGLDNWLYAAGAGAHNPIRSLLRPGAQPVDTRGSDFRFRPDAGAVEPVSGRAQYGIGMDDWGNRFTNSNSDHIRHVVIPTRYLERNPFVSLPDTMHQIADHGPAGEVYQTSYLQPRFNDFSAAGHFTSACSPTVYRGSALPALYQGALFVCEPVASLVHCDVLTPDGPTFVARRPQDRADFLTSTDNWCRPVTLAGAPDGSLYVVDMYREHIEHPEWIPYTTMAKINVRAGDDRGRIYRVSAESFRPNPPPNLAAATTDQLIAYLSDSNGWIRDTAQRLLVERADRRAIPALRQIALHGTSPIARLRAVWVLEGLGALDGPTVQQALADEHPRIRENAIFLAEPRLPLSPTLRSKLLSMTADPDPRVRFQLALSLGSIKGPAATGTLADLARAGAANPWQQKAVLLSSAGREEELLRVLTANGSPESNAAADFIGELLAVIGARRDSAQIARIVSTIATSNHDAVAWWHAPALDGLAAGLKRRTGSPLQLAAQKQLVQLITTHDRDLARAARRLAAQVEMTNSPDMQQIVAQALAVAENDAEDTQHRVEAVEVAGRGPFATVAPRLSKLLAPQAPLELQTACARVLLDSNPQQAFAIALANWRSYSPPVRTAVLQSLITQRGLRPTVLSALEEMKIAPTDLNLQQRTALLTDSDLAFQRRAQAVLSAAAKSADRQKIVDEYRDALTMKADAARGWQVFRDHCAACHKLENLGQAIGPDLATVRNHPKEALLQNILNPSHTLEPKYMTYVVETNSGRVLNGLIISETSHGLTLLGPDNTQQIILRRDIEQLQSTGKSLMPEGLEQLVPKQGLADIIAFLRKE